MLRQVRGATLQNTAYHQQANAITLQVLQENRTDHSRVLDQVKHTGAVLLQAIQVSQSHHDDKENCEPTLIEEYTNAVTNTLLQQQILKNYNQCKKRYTS